MPRTKKRTRRNKSNIQSSSSPSLGNDECDVPSKNSVELRTNLTNAILSSSSTNGMCVSYDEAFGIAEAVLIDYYGDTNAADMNLGHVDVKSMAALLCDYMPQTISTLIEAEQMIRTSIGRDDDHEHDHSIDDDDDADNNHNDPEPSDDDDDDDDGNYIQDGECELCERHMKLTRHHLIPKETWARIKPRLLDAAPFYSTGDIQTANDITRLGTLSFYGRDDGSSMVMLLQGLDSSLAARTFLGGYVAKVCRQCHSMVHRFFTNMELAERYNTVDKLLEDERVYKFCKWSNKQRPGHKT